MYFFRILGAAMSVSALALASPVSNVVDIAERVNHGPQILSLCVNLHVNAKIQANLIHGLCLNSATSPSVLSAAVANLTHIITSGTSQVKKVASSSRSCGCASSSTAISKEVASLIADVSKILVDVHDIIDQQCTNSQELWSSFDNSIYGLLRCLDGLVGGVIAKVSKILKNITATLNILRLTKTLSCLGLTVSSILGTVPKIIGAL